MNPNEDGWRLTDEESAAEALAARSQEVLGRSYKQEPAAMSLQKAHDILLAMWQEHHNDDEQREALNIATELTQAELRHSTHFVYDAEGKPYID